MKFHDSDYEKKLCQSEERATALWECVQVTQTRIFFALTVFITYFQNACIKFYASLDLTLSLRRALWVYLRWSDENDSLLGVATVIWDVNLLVSLVEGKTFFTSKPTRKGARSVLNAFFGQLILFQRKTSLQSVPCKSVEIQQWHTD